MPSLTQPAATLIAALGSAVVAFLAAMIGLYVGLRRHKGEKAFEEKLKWLVGAHDRAWTTSTTLNRAQSELLFSESKPLETLITAHENASNALQQLQPICLQAMIYAGEDIVDKAQDFWANAETFLVTSHASQYRLSSHLVRSQTRSDREMLMELEANALTLAHAFGSAARTQLGLNALLPPLPKRIRNTSWVTNVTQRAVRRVKSIRRRAKILDVNPSISSPTRGAQKPTPAVADPVADPSEG
jgi:hypothetical protein